MRALLAALLTAATLPVLPASDASKLVADVAGKPARPVVLHFWATWCEACRDEFPSIRREYKLLSLPAVLLDAPEPDPVARAIGEPTWDGTLPATFVFDGNGKLSKSFVGRADPAALAAAVRAVKR